MEDRFAKPFIIDESGAGRALERVEFGQPPFTEGEIQELLRIHPALLSIDQIDPVFSPAVCIGREVPTRASGTMDNLYVSPQGYVTLVETKLWKNPEQRREVVAQILDYAKELSKWTYAELERLLKEYLDEFHPKEPQKLLAQWVAEQSDERIDEQDFVDSVSRCLKRGRFLLLIVGEGIRESAQDLAEHLLRTPELGYNLNLVELGCYRFQKSSKPLVIVPRVIVRTAEIERAVVRIEMVKPADTHVAVSVSTPQSEDRADAKGRRITITETDFLERLAKAIGPTNLKAVQTFVEEVRKLGVEPEYKGSSVSLRYQPAAEDLPKLSVLSVEADGWIWSGDWLEKQLERGGASPKPARQFWKQLHEIDSRFLVGATNHLRSDGHVPLREIIPKLPQIAEAVSGLIRDVEATST